MQTSLAAAEMEESPSDHLDIRNIYGNTMIREFSRQNGLLPLLKRTKPMEAYAPLDHIIKPDPFEEQLYSMQFQNQHKSRSFEFVEFSDPTDEPQPRDSLSATTALTQPAYTNYLSSLLPNQSHKTHQRSSQDTESQQSAATSQQSVTPLSTTPRRFRFQPETIASTQPETPKVSAPEVNASPAKGPVQTVSPPKTEALDEQRGRKTPKSPASGAKPKEKEEIPLPKKKEVDTGKEASTDHTSEKDTGNLSDNSDVDYDEDETDSAKPSKSKTNQKKRKRSTVRRNLTCATTHDKKRKRYYRTEETKKCWMCQRASADMARRPCVDCGRPTCPCCIGQGDICPPCSISMEAESDSVRNEISTRFFSETNVSYKQRDCFVQERSSSPKRSQVWTRGEVRALIAELGSASRKALKKLRFEGWIRVLRAVPGRTVSGIWKTMYRHNAELESIWHQVDSDPRTTEKDETAPAEKKRKIS